MLFELKTAFAQLIPRFPSMHLTVGQRFLEAGLASDELELAAAAPSVDLYRSTVRTRGPLSMRWWPVPMLV
jgi:hypothetical protein